MNDQERIQLLGASARRLVTWEGFEVDLAEGDLAGLAATHLALFVDSGQPRLHLGELHLQLERGDTVYLPAGSEFTWRGAGRTVVTQVQGPAPSGPAVTGAGGGRSVWLVGDHYHWKLRGADTAGLLSLWDFEVLPGGGPPPHRHRHEDEVFVFLQGTIRLMGELDAVPGEAVFLPRGELHWFSNPTDQPAEMLGLLTPAALERFFLEAGTPEPAPPDPEGLVRIASRYGIEFG